MESDHRNGKNDDKSTDTILFAVDSKPSRNNEKVFIPEYSCKRKYKLTENEVKDLEEEQAKRRRGLGGVLCWNCNNSGHSNRECKEPVNYSNLARNRKRFNSQRPTGKNGVTRYHQDNEQKYDHLKAGTVSEKLRRALGLKKDQLPRHIYSMRFLGYPPGWLEEAKILHSGISLFDSKGKAVADPDDEEGEVVESFEQRNKYDITQLIRYPGFNILPPGDVIDESDKLNAPPINPEQSLENFVASLKPNAAKAYHKRKTPVAPSASPPAAFSQESVRTAVDMDYEDTPETDLLPEDGCSFVPSLPEEQHIPAPPPPPPPEILSEYNESSLPSEVPTTEDGECSSQSGERGSPTLCDLELQKQSILSELNNTNSCDSLGKEIMSTIVKNNSNLSPSIDNCKEIISPTLSRLKRSEDSTSRTPSPNLGQMKSVELGTPVLKSVSSFSKLPTPESFSQNICDVINFENLPGYTGIYDKMINVIDKVRSAVKRIHHSSD